MGTLARTTGQMQATRLGVVMGLALVALASAAGATDAEPLRLSVEGFLPTVTVTQQSTLLGDQNTPLPPVVQTFTNVAFAGTFTFDSDRWALATPDPTVAPGFQRLIDSDPPDPLATVTDPGITTEEWLRGSMTLALSVPQTFALDRDFVNNRPAGAQTVVGFNGFQEIAYQNSSPGLPLNVFDLATSGSFGYLVASAPSDPNVPFGQFESWSFPMFLVQGPTTDGSFVDLFGPGAPTSLIWDDPTPLVCVSLTDCLPQGNLPIGNFQFHTTNLFLLAPGSGRSDDTNMVGNLLFTHVTLEPEAAPVPEPATLVTSILGLAALAANRRRARRASPVT